MEGVIYARRSKRTELLKAWMEEKGFCTYFDEVGNLFGRIAGKKEEVILTGSHRDTVKMAENMMERWASLRR